jgi:hypothetical protein
MVPILDLISKLNSNGVEYIVIGGVAANLHGSPLLTRDLGVCCPMTEQNMARLLDSVGSLHPVSSIRGESRSCGIPPNSRSFARS